MRLRCNIAGLRVVVEAEYERTISQVKAYVTGENWDEDEADYLVALPEGLIERQLERNSNGATPEVIEYMYSGSIFYRKLLQYNGLMLHSSAVVVDGYAYLFSADSGTGKSTHTGLWLKHFGDRAYILNDDKPAVRKLDGKWYAYGTPWSGKHDISVNAGAELGGIVFLERSEENHIEEMPVSEAIPKFVAQTTRKLHKIENMDLLLENLSDVLMSVPVYRLQCNISDEAVVTSYEKIRRI